MNSETFFVPIALICTNKEDYKKVQVTKSNHSKSSKLYDAINEAYGFSEIDKESFIMPVMQLYNPIDFNSRKIDCFLEVLSDASYREFKKASKLLPLSKPLTSFVYSSTGDFGHEEMKPKFKPLNEVPTIKDTLINGEIPQGTSAMLFFVLPVVVSHNSQKKLDKIIDFMFERDINEDKMHKLRNSINEYFGIINPSTLAVFPISHTAYMEEEFDMITDSMKIAQFEQSELKEKNEPFVNINKTGRNDKCHCGSGKKYKQCCIYELN